MNRSRHCDENKYSKKHVAFLNGFEPGATHAIGLALDSSGNFDVIVTHGAGGVVPGASLTGNAEYTNAGSLDDLKGEGLQVGASAGKRPTLVGGAMFGPCYSS
jgi:hypothetical protein